MGSGNLGREGRRGRQVIKTARAGESTTLSKTKQGRTVSLLRKGEENRRALTEKKGGVGQKPPRRAV